MVSSNHRCCAERRLISHFVQQARKKGVPPARVVSWVRRKMGTEVCIWRQCADGSYGCSVPCPMCAKVLIRFDVKVRCCLGDGQWFKGRLDDPGAPMGKPTTYQRLTLNFRDEETKAGTSARAGSASGTPRSRS